jgi:membrane associated rhomboid family serine protease
MFLLIPYRADVPMQRWPVANFVLLGCLAAVFVGELTSPEAAVPFVLNGWTFQGLLGHSWLHVGLLHLAGNLLFLWLFGNAVCAKLGNLPYLGYYLGLGLVAGIAHLMFSGEPAVGASGAINGIVGLYLVFFPLNDISCFWLLIIRPGQFSVSGFWLILLWLAFDLFGALTGVGNTAYFAHLGGLAAGFGLGSLLVLTKWVPIESYERSIYQAIGLQKVAGAEEPPKRDRAPAPPAASIPSPGASLGHESAATACPLVELRCSCGRVLKAPQAWSGRMVRCPSCTQVLRVPGADPKKA